MTCEELLKQRRVNVAYGALADAILKNAKRDIAKGRDVESATEFLESDWADNLRTMISMSDKIRNSISSIAVTANVR